MIEKGILYTANKNDGIFTHALTAEEVNVKFQLAKLSFSGSVVERLYIENSVLIFLHSFYFARTIAVGILSVCRREKIYGRKKFFINETKKQEE